MQRVRIIIRVEDEDAGGRPAGVMHEIDPLLIEQANDSREVIKCEIEAAKEKLRDFMSRGEG